MRKSSIDIIIHGILYALIVMNIVWGGYLIYVTYSLSAHLFFFSLIAILIPLFTVIYLKIKNG